MAQTAQDRDAANQAANQFAQFANCVHALRNLLRQEEVTARYFGSGDQLHENVARCANELGADPSNIHNELTTPIRAWKEAADQKIFDYGTITVGNNAAGTAASVVSWIPIAGQVILASQMIAHAACGPEIQERRDAVKNHFDSASAVLQDVECIRGTTFILTTVGNLPRGDPRYAAFDEIGPAILGLVNLLAQQDQHWTAELVKEQIDAISEISPRKRPDFKPWKITNAAFKLDLERIASSMQGAQLALSIAYLGRGILLSQLANFCVTLRVVRTTHEFASRFAGTITNRILAFGVLVSIATVVVNIFALDDAIETRNNLYKKAIKIENKLNTMVREVVKAMKSLRAE